jgi:hypothetical protein
MQWNLIQPQRRMKFCHFGGKWIELENITLSEVSQVQKAKGCMFSLICGMYLIQTQQYYEIQVILNGCYI